MEHIRDITLDHCIVEYTPFIPQLKLVKLVCNHEEDILCGLPRVGDIFGNTWPYRPMARLGGSTLINDLLLMLLRKD